MSAHVTKGKVNFTIFRRKGGAAQRRGDAGFTLIELMIAMILGLIVIAGVTSIFLAGQQSYRTNNALGEVESGSRIAFEFLARDIRQAGLTGCDTAGGRIANVLNNKSTAWWANWGNALHGYGGANSSAADSDSDQGDPATGSAFGTGAGDRVAGTDSLQVIGAAGLPVTIEEDKEPAANFKLNQATSELADGDIIIVCSPDHSTILQISNYNSGNVTVVHNTGGSITPGNCSKGLGYPTVCTTNGNIYSFPRNSAISTLSASDWYIGYNDEGGKSLYRMGLANTGGKKVSASAQEMVRNVTDMQITYLQGATYLSAAAVTDWSAVTAAHVTLTVESNFQRASASGDKPIVRTYSATTTVRNRVN